MTKDDILKAALRSGIAHNNGAGGQYLLCATEAQLTAFAAALELAEVPTPEQSVNAAVPEASGQGPAGLPPTGASGAK